MRSVLRVALILFVMIVVTSFGVADACTCVGPTPMCVARSADAIFVADAATESRGLSEVVAHLTVRDAFKGVAIGDSVAIVQSTLSPCAADFEDGERYLVYASRDSAGELHTTMCDVTHLQEVRAGELGNLAALRSGRGRTDILGTLTVIPDNEPLAGIEVVASGGGAYKDRTDRQGRFRIRVPHGGDYVLKALLPDTLTQLSGPEDLSAHVHVEPHACATTNLRTAINARITGRLLAPPGVDVSQVWVEAWSVTGLRYRGAKTDASGQFEIAGFIPGRYVLGTGLMYCGPAFRRPYAQVLHPGVAGSANTTEYTIDGPVRFADQNLPFGGGIRPIPVDVRVVDETGAPVTGAKGSAYSPCDRVGADGGSDHTGDDGHMTLQVYPGRGWTIRVVEEPKLDDVLLHERKPRCSRRTEIGPVSFPASVTLTVSPQNCSVLEPVRAQPD